MARKRLLKSVQLVNFITSEFKYRIMPPITFTNADFQDVDSDQDDDLMVITVKIKNCAVMKVLVDQGSTLDILYWKTY